MPQIKIERIVSFSSEDASYPASNVLSRDSSKKWKCKTAGEKSAAIVLQLDQPYVISGIDIGNENSGYIEVLVSRSTSPDDFKVLLVMSSFMSPLEARQTQNVNKVRMFKSGDLTEPQKNEKWDRIKIVCTQPFNRHVQYGLSFVNLYSLDVQNSENKQQGSIGKFVIRPSSPDIAVGSVFERWKQVQDSGGEKALKGAAAIREATSLAHSGSPMPKQKVKLNLPATPKAPSTKNHIAGDDTPKEKQDRNRNELLYSKDEEDKHDKIDRLVEKKSEEIKRSEKITEKQKEQKQTPSKHSKESASKPKGSSSNESLKRKPTMPLNPVIKKQKKQTGKLFEKLLEDVVLVISGIQNPDRASLRSMAISMGAKYKPDWDNSCTHLICAFANTPKFNQVKGKGKIVKRGWLEDCYEKRKKLPWRRYALDKADQGQESEEEVCEIDNILSPEADGINSDTDEDMREQSSDTDEKIAEIQRKQAESKQSLDEFSVDTDTETDKKDGQVDLEIERKLQDFFEDKIFYVDEKFDYDLERKIRQYIVAYNGILTKNYKKSIDVIVTNKENYKLYKEISPTTICVAPDWIWECHNRQKLVPMKDFIFE